MAEQQGILVFSGKIGEIVGYNRGKKKYARGKAKPYELTDESKKSGTEFGRGSTACALVKQAFSSLILSNFKTDLHNRLSEKLREVIRSGPIAKKGKRRVFDGDISLLKGFGFSSYTSFGRLVFFSPVVEISAESIRISIPAFTWKDLKAPEKASRVIFGMAAGYFDFHENTYRTTLAGNLEADKGKPFSGASITIPIPPLNEQAVLVMMNVFFEETHGSRVFKIDRRNCQAGIILDAVHIRKGKVLVFKQEKVPAVEMKLEVTPDVSWVINAE